MKRILFIVFAMMMATTYSFAQKIVIDKVDADGFRTISTDHKVTRDFKDKIVFSYGVAAYTDGKRTSYELSIDLGCKEGNEVKKDAKVLIRTFKSNIIEASVSMDNYAKANVQNINGIVFTNYNLYISIELTHDQLQQLANEGIKKIRIEGNMQNYEKEYSKDKTSKIISERLALVDKALSNKKSFSDDF